MEEGYLIIKHQIFRSISDEEVLQFIPIGERTPKYRIIDIKKEIISMEQIHTLDNFGYKTYQKKVMDEQIKPFIHDHPNYKILYFGAATIPMALHLGFCFGGWNEVLVYLLDRESNQWLPLSAEAPELETTESFVNEEFQGPVEVIYKVEATYRVEDDELKEVVQTNAKTIGLKLNKLGKNVFTNQKHLTSFAYKFSLGLDSIANNLRNTDKIHLFPTVPVGLAFLMGTKINPLITKPVVLYQHDTNDTPRYKQILILQEANSVDAIIAEEDEVFIKQVKDKLKVELEERISSYVESKSEEVKKRKVKLLWIDSILTGQDFIEIKRGLWKRLPDISSTILGSSKFSSSVDQAGESFHISEDNEWQISDRFIFNIKNRLNGDPDKIIRALRMYIFHEGLHVNQNLTNYTAASIGRFPRVLEEVDYMADVWAMLHEYAYSKIHYAGETKEIKTFFKNLILIAANTMWAFDDLDPNIEEMQIRRVNRYLLWYWNYIQIEDRSCQTLEDIINILANKPIVEIRGLDIRAQAQRTVFRLVNYKNDDLEMGCIDSQGIVRRTANSNGIELNELVKGFKERNGDKILKQLKSWFHAIRN